MIELTVCPWCNSPESEDYDCHERCKCVCHAIAEGQWPILQDDD